MCACTGGRKTTHRRRPIAASPNHTDNLLDFTFLLFCCCCSSRLVWYVMHFFTFFSPLLTFLIFFASFFTFLFFAHFFLLYFSSSFSRARVVFSLILFFFLLLLLWWLLRPFSHAPPRLLIARNRCDFAHLYVFFFVLSSAHVFTRFVSARTTRLLRLVIAAAIHEHTHSRTHAHTRGGKGDKP